MPEISAAAMQPKMYEDSHYPTYLRRFAPIPCERCEGCADQNRFDQRFTFVRKGYHVSAGARRFSFIPLILTMP